MPGSWFGLLSRPGSARRTDLCHRHSLWWNTYLQSQASLILAFSGDASTNNDTTRSRSCYSQWVPDKESKRRQILIMVKIKSNIWNLNMLNLKRSLNDYDAQQVQNDSMMGGRMLIEVNREERRMCLVLGDSRYVLSSVQCLYWVADLNTRLLNNDRYQSQHCLIIYPMKLFMNAWIRHCCYVPATYSLGKEIAWLKGSTLLKHNVFLLVMRNSLEWDLQCHYLVEVCIFTQSLAV